MNFSNSGLSFIITVTHILTKYRQEWNDALAATNTIFTSVASGQIHMVIALAQ